jgi:hypothetical protein
MAVSIIKLLNKTIARKAHTIDLYKRIRKDMEFITRRPFSKVSYTKNTVELNDLVDGSLAIKKLKKQRKNIGTLAAKLKVLTEKKMRIKIRKKGIFLGQPLDKSVVKRIDAKRRIAARAKGIRFIKVRGKIVPIRAKK